MQGVIIDHVIGVGTTNEDTLGFVQCRFNDGDTRAIAFSPELASIVTTAFLAASGHLQQKQQMRGDDAGMILEPRALPIADAQVAFGKSLTSEKEIVLKLLTKAGATLSVSLPCPVIRKTISECQNALDVLDSLAL